MRASWAGYRRPLSAAGLCTVLFITLTTCTDSGPASLDDAASPEGLSFTIVSGDGQKWIGGYELPAPIVVKATDEKGRSVRSQLVNFRVIRGGGSMFAGSAVTDEQGIAQDYWALGIQPGENVLEVRAVDPTTGEKQVYAQFTATGLPGAEGLSALTRLFSHEWVIELAERIRTNQNGKGTALLSHFEEIVAALYPGGVLAEVDGALTSIQALLSSPTEDNPVEYAFLAHVARFCRDRFDAVMQSVPQI